MLSADGATEDIIQTREEFFKEWICREKFEEFFWGFNREKVEKGNFSWANAVSPHVVGRSDGVNS